MSFVYKTLEWIRWMFGIFPRTAIGSRTKFLIVHYSFVAVIFLLLCIFTPQLRVPLHLPDMEHVPWVNRILVGLLFLLLYALVRVVLILVQLLGIEEESEFPDIESDWQEIQSALDREGLFLDELPLFLVNGLTPDQEKTAFEAASGITWRVSGSPFNRPNAAVRAYASENAIYLSCTNVGTTNLQQGKISRDSSASPLAAPGVTGTRKAGGALPTGSPIIRPLKGPATGTIVSLGDPEPAIGEETAVAKPGGFGEFFRTMAPGGLDWANRTVMPGRIINKGFGKQRLEPLGPLDIEVGNRRMAFLCDLIEKARYPYCQINGMIQAYPLSWASDSDYSRKLAPAIRNDLATVHECFQLQFPVVAVVTEVDVIAGVKDFLMRSERLQPGLRRTRAGASYVSGAEPTEANAQWIVDKGMEWFRGWVYTAFSADLDNRDNPKLFQMMCEISQRRAAMAALISSTLYRVCSPGIRLQGVYFAATGRSQQEQGFIRGVLDKVIDSQSLLAWTPLRLIEQKRSGVLTLILGSLSLVMFVLAIWIYADLWRPPQTP